MTQSGRDHEQGNDLQPERAGECTVDGALLFGRRIIRQRLCRSHDAFMPAERLLDVGRGNVGDALSQFISNRTPSIYFNIL
ncbi:hypothetical protein [Methanoculleus sp.]|uniref:hypothetical protein n=1 Tax=Methanoculleus sp. TaxID=90427 RepID=UPI001BD3BD12|nr:hypothetical protein [Methanoculleus sp.]